jgi:hypothetical protein
MKPRTNQRPTSTRASRALNAHRAARVELALAVYSADGADEEPRDVLCDLVADLGHLSDAKGIDFEPLVDMALMHWRVEREAGLW